MPEGRGPTAAPRRGTRPSPSTARRAASAAPQPSTTSSAAAVITSRASRIGEDAEQRVEQVAAGTGSAPRPTPMRDADADPAVSVGSILGRDGRQEGHQRPAAARWRGLRAAGSRPSAGRAASTVRRAPARICMTIAVEVSTKPSAGDERDRQRESRATPTAGQQQRHRRRPAATPSPKICLRRLQSRAAPFRAR